MLDVLEARQTLYDAITAGVGVLIPTTGQAFPGVAVNTDDLPRMEVIQVSARHPVRTLKGNVHSEEGVIQVFIVGEKGIGEASVMAIAQTLAAALTIGTTYAISGGGSVQMTDHPSIRPGYADDTSWRVPIELQYRANA